MLLLTNISNRCRNVNSEKKILKLAKNRGFISPRDVESLGIGKMQLYRLWKRGKLVRVGRGLYSIPNLPDTEHLNLIEVAKRVPRSVICLLSALSFHGITTQLPHEVWITLPRGSHRPKFDYPVTDLTYASPKIHEFGVETHNIKGIEVKVYTPAKTVADCFKFRSKVGLEVAVESLRDTLRLQKATLQEIVRAAEVCRVWKVMRPYLETLA